MRSIARRGISQDPDPNCSPWCGSGNVPRRDRGCPSRSVAELSKGSSGRFETSGYSRALSAENVELVRRIIEAFRTRDNAWLFEVYDPDVEWDVSRVPWTLELGFEPIYRGHDGVRAFWRQWLDAWESIEFRVDDVIDGGDEVVRAHLAGQPWPC
jgi:hypothetical protein